MQQVLQNYKTGELRVADVPAPTLDPDGVIVLTRASLISAGTERQMLSLAQKSLLGKAMARPDLVRQVLQKLKRDGLAATMRTVEAKLDDATPLGYSSAGVVLEVGSAVTGLIPGQRVACAGAGYAGHAEVAYVPHNLCVPLPDTVSFEHGSFVALGAIAMQGVRALAPQLGETVVLIGLGLVGQLTLQLLRAAGAVVIGVDPSPSRRAEAEKLGAVTFDTADPDLVERIRERTRRRGADGVIIAASTDSAEPMQLAADVARDRGTICLLGVVKMELPHRLFFNKDLRLVMSRSYGPGRYDPQFEERGLTLPVGYVPWSETRNMEAFLEMAGDGRLQVAPLLTHTFPIADAIAAYDLVQGRVPGNFLGIVLTYPELSGAAPARLVRTASPIAGPEPQIAVVGAGAYARSTMLPALDKAGAKIGAIVSSGGVSAEFLARKTGAPAAASDADEVLTVPGLRGVVVLTRHDHHADYTARALAAGKGVLVEKPLAITVEELARVTDAFVAADAAGQVPVLMVGFNRRYAPMTDALRAHFAGVGPLVVQMRVNAGVVDAKHWVHDPVLGGGRLIGEGCHFLDYVQELVGHPITSVRTTGIGGGLDAREHFVVSMTLADGSIGTVSYFAHGDKGFSKERVEVFGGGRVGVLEDFRRLELFGGRRGQRTGEQDKGHVAEVTRFVQALRGAVDVRDDAIRALTSSAATIAAQESLRTGETVPVTPPVAWR